MVKCSKPLVRLGSFRFAQSEWTRNRFGFGLYSHGLFRGEQIDGCSMASICHIDCYGHGFNPEKLCSEMKGISGGLNLGSEFNPEKLCSEMKGNSGGLNQDVGPSSTPKSRVQRWKVSVGGWTSGLSSTPKSCAQRWKVPVGGWARMWVPVQPRKAGFRDESHQWGVEPRVWVQPRKVVFRDER